MRGMFGRTSRKSVKSLPGGDLDPESRPRGKRNTLTKGRRLSTKSENHADLGRESGASGNKGGRVQSLRRLLNDKGSKAKGSNKQEAAKAVAFAKLENELLFAAAEGDVPRIERMCRLVDVNCVDDFSMTPLHVAAFNGMADACLYLMKAGADIEAVDEWGRNCIHQAASNGHTSTVIALLATGASHLVSEQDTEGATALHLAAENDHIETVAALIEAGCDVNVFDWWSKSPLLIAAENGHAKTLKELIKSGGKLSAVDDWGRTALHLAVECNSPDAVKAILAGTGLGEGVELVNVMDKSSYTPYALAIDNKYAECASAIKAAADKAAKRLQTAKDSVSLKNTKAVRSNVDRNRKQMKKQRQATLERIVNARKVNVAATAAAAEQSETWDEDKKLIDENFEAFKKVMKSEKWIALMLRPEVLDYYLAHPQTKNRTKD